jgi:protein BCP1
LFASDAELLELGDFADIMIEENQVGTTVKVDDQKSDPYAVLSIINLNHQKVIDIENVYFGRSTY